MYFPTTYHRSYPQITPKPHFGGPLNAKPIIQIALRKSHVNGAMKVKLYSYIGIGKYLGGCQNFFDKGHPGGHKFVNLEPTISQKLLELER